MCLVRGTNELVGETDFLGRMKPRVGVWGDLGVNGGGFRKAFKCCWEGR